MSRDGLAAVARRRYWREADAEVVVEAWRSSGVSLAAFARQHVIDRQRLGRWASRLGERAGAGVQFHPVRLSVGSEGLRHGASIEIELGGGRRVRVAPGFEAEDLRRVLAVLAEEAATC